MRVSWGRWLFSFVIGYVVASGSNWFVAERFLNPIIKAGFGDLMRTGGTTTAGDITNISAGFALLMLIVSLLVALLRAPDAWAKRGLTAGVLVSLALFGVYTFLSGWLTLPTREMCLTASTDSVTIILGAVLMAYIQDWRQRA
jgi:hypothetical protein